MDTSYFAVSCLLSFFLGLIPAVIASKKGYNFLLFWLFGTAIFIAALPVAIVIQDKSGSVGEGNKKCPYCAEIVKIDAVICKHCGKELQNKSMMVSELEQIVIERKKTSQSVIDHDEEIKWRAAFSSIGWLEPIGNNTNMSLRNAGVIKPENDEPIILTTYFDVPGTRLTQMRYNETDLSSNFSGLIATGANFHLIRPEKDIVKTVKFSTIQTVEVRDGLDNMTQLALSITNGDRVLLTIKPRSEVDLRIITLFFNRITPGV